MNRLRVLVATALPAVRGSANAELTQEQAERAVGSIPTPNGSKRTPSVFWCSRRCDPTRLLPIREPMTCRPRHWMRLGSSRSLVFKIEATIEASQRLMTVASTGAEGAMREAIGNLGSTCGSFHDDFRVDD